MIYIIQSIDVARFANNALNLIKGGSTALPGKIAETIDKNYLKKINIEDSFVIFITGTNGKTTTTAYLRQMIARLLKNDKTNVLCNEEGSNMMQGIGTTLIQSAKKDGDKYFIKDKIIVLEVDELTVPKIIKHGIKPNLIIITNIEKDQEDRTNSPEYVGGLLNKTIKEENINTIIFKPYSNHIKGQDKESGKTNFTWDYKKTKDQITVELKTFDSEIISTKTIKRGIDYPDSVPEYLLINWLNAYIVTVFLQETDIIPHGIIKVANLDVSGRNERITVKSAYLGNYISLNLDLCKNESGLDAVIKSIKPEREFIIAVNLGRQVADGNNLSWFFNYDMNELISSPYFKGLYVTGDFPDYVIDEYNKKFNINAKNINHIYKLKQNNSDVYYICNYSKLKETKNAIEKRRYLIEGV